MVRIPVAEAKARREWFIEKVRLGFSIGECCDYSGVSRATVQSWRAHHPEFSARLSEALDEARAAKKAYDGSFVSFRRVYLAMESTWFQRQIAEAIENAEPGEVVLVLIPPEHGKTTLLEDWCTYKLCTDPSFRITVASETVDHGVKILDRVRQRLEPDGPTPTIHRDFGPLAPQDGSKKDQVWSAKHFNVAKKKASDERDYSMHAVGITGRVQGTRCDLLLLDDMQDVKSLDQTEKYTEIVVQSFLSRPSMFGRTVIIGTRVGEFDVYRQLMDRGIPDHVVKIAAYDVNESPTWPAPADKPKRDDPSTWAPPGVKFLWPQKYDAGEEGMHRFRYAALRHRVGEVAWARNYMQRPEAAAVMTFDEATTDRMKDTTRSVIGLPRRTPGGGQVQVVVGLDPSIGGGNGIVTAAMYPDRLEVLHCRLDYGLSKYSSIIDLVEEECHRYSTEDSYVSTLVVEDKAFQRGLLRDDRLEELQTRFGFRIVPNTTGREKADPDIGVAAMPISMIRQEITIPWADQPSVDNMEQLLGHLHIWRPGVPGNKLPQDMVMALWFVWRHWRAVGKNKITHLQVDPDEFASRPSPLRHARTRTRRQYRRPYRTLGTRRP